MFRALLATALLLPFANAYGVLYNVKEAFEDANIVPSIVPVFNPTIELYVEYTNNVSYAHVEVMLGNALTTNDVFNEPSFAISDPECSNKYVVVMIDPDAPLPSAPTHAQVRHYVGDNYSVTPTKHNSKGPSPIHNSTQPLGPYYSPAPPVGSPPHRYILLLYKQPYNFSAPVFATYPTNWNVSAWATQYGLGAPVGGNFYYCSA